MGSVGLSVLFFRPVPRVPLDVQERSFRLMLELARDRRLKPCSSTTATRMDEGARGVRGRPGSRGGDALLQRRPAFARRCASRIHRLVSGIVPSRAPRTSRTPRARSRTTGTWWRPTRRFSSPVPMPAGRTCRDESPHAAGWARLRGAPEAAVRAATTPPPIASSGSRRGGTAATRGE